MAVLALSLSASAVSVHTDVEWTEFYWSEKFPAVNASDLCDVKYPDILMVVQVDDSEKVLNYYVQGDLALHPQLGNDFVITPGMQLWLWCYTPAVLNFGHLK